MAIAVGTILVVIRETGHN